MPMTNNAPHFETRVCGRCLGSGWYSYCETWGHTCFQCGVKAHEQGLGRYLTRRGSVAHEYYLSLLPSRRAEELQPGDVIRDRSYGWLPVVSVGDNAVERVSGRGNPDGTFTYDGVNIRLKTNPPMTLTGVSRDTIYVVRPTAEQRAVALAQALEYQATLTKAGKPAKRRRAKVAVEPQDGEELADALGYDLHPEGVA